MSERTLLVSLVAYDLWATRRVIAAAGRLPAAALDAPSANRDWTVRSGFAHVLDATAYWLGQVEWRRAPPIEAAMLPDVESISDVADRLGTALGGYVADLPVGGLSREIMHRPGEPARPVHEALIHLLMHSAHHRGELAALLTTLGASPGDLDVMDFLRERDALTPHAED